MSTWKMYILSRRNRDQTLKQLYRKRAITLSAIEDDYEPGYKSQRRIEQLIAFGHDPTKIELLLLVEHFYSCQMTINVISSNHVMMQ